MSTASYVIGLLSVCSLSLAVPAFADDTVQSSSNSSSSSSSSTSSSQTSEQSGVMGIRQSNKFAPKYKERIETYKHQIQLGLTRGWLSAEDAEKFTKELGRLAELEASVSGKGYIKAEVDDLDKQLTKFNMDFTNAGQKKPAAAATPAPSASPTAAATPAAAATKPDASKPAAKPAAASTAKPVAKAAAKTAAKKPGGKAAPKASKK